MNRIIASPNRSFAPFILWDAIAGKFRLWYNEGVDGSVKFMHRESPDAITWSAPIQIVRPINAYGTTVIDEGVAGPQRFKNVYWTSGPGIDGGHCAVSADGLSWSEVGTPPMFSPASAWGDKFDLWKHPLSGKYQVFLRIEPIPPRKTYWSQSTVFSGAASNWSAPQPAFLADALDVPPTTSGGGIQFYGAAGPIMRDGLMIFFLRVLRDDINSGSGNTQRGTGYTVLAWSRDGINFSRAREPFLAGVRGSRDEAGVFVHGAAEHDGTLYLSYTAYELGHKVGNRYAGVASMPSSDLVIA